MMDQGDTTWPSKRWSGSGLIQKRKLKVEIQLIKAYHKILKYFFSFF